MVNYHLLNNSVVLNFQGKTITISGSDSRYEKVIECIQNDELELIPGLVDLAKGLADKGLDVREGIIYVKDQPMPESLSKRILQYREENLPFDSLFRFWDNLKQNPSFNARQMLYTFLEHNGHPLTNDGCFIAYRGCDDDFKDRYSGNFDNSPGAVCEMPREEVDDNPNNTCSAGLHVACHNYAYNWATKTVEVKVHPRDVVAVPADYEGNKMRVCRFEVIQECEQMRTETLYTDDDSYEEPEIAPECNYCGELAGYCECLDDDDQGY